jgi:hypothetical protein
MGRTLAFAIAGGACSLPVGMPRIAARCATCNVIRLGFSQINWSRRLLVLFHLNDPHGWLDCHKPTLSGHQVSRLKIILLWLIGVIRAGLAGGAGRSINGDDARRPE